MPQEEKDKIKEHQRKKNQELVQYKKGALKNKIVLSDKFKHSDEGLPRRWNC